MTANEAERRRWNDERYAAAWPKREQLTGVVTPVLLETAKLKPGNKVLDIGSGGGGSAIAAGRAVGPKGMVVGIDLSLPLTPLAIQRAKDARAGNVTFKVADAQHDQIASRAFDVAMSQFGVMFFDEPVAAFTNIRQHLRDDGRLVFACWQPANHNPWHVGTALQGLLPPASHPAPGKSAVGPFTLGELVHTTVVLEKAGFAGVRLTPHAVVVRASADAVVDESLLGVMGIPPDRLDESRAIVASHLAKFASTQRGLYRFPIAFLIVEATNPGG